MLNAQYIYIYENLKKLECIFVVFETSSHTLAQMNLKSL